MASLEFGALAEDSRPTRLGFRAEAGGLFVSGGSIANLAAARQTKDYSSGRLRMYASRATHFSIAKAAAPNQNRFL